MRVAKIMFLMLISINLGCMPSFDECDMDKSKAILHSKRGDYQKKVLKNLVKYQKLKDFIMLNLDTLLSHNQKRCIRSITTVNGKSDTVFCDPLSYVTFYDYGEGNMIKDQLPAHLYARFMALYNSINPDKSHTVSFERDGRVFMFLTNEKYDENRIKILHLLEWNGKLKRNNLAPLEKDTLLDNGARYRIYTDCYRGH